MTKVSIRIENLAELRENFRKAPAITLRYLANATKAAVFEVEKQAVDSNFRFKTPRSFRSGYLSLSFAFGRRFENNGLRGIIGPTAHYAPYVHRDNPFMERIAGSAERAIEGHFEQAIDGIATSLAKV